MGDALSTTPASAPAEPKARSRDLRVLPDDHVVRGGCPLDCPDTCAWEVTVRDGQAIALRGAKDHPYTLGSLCVKTSGYLDHMRAPDRLLHPLRRVGAKGEGRFERITWDDAIGEIGARLTEIIDRHGAEAIWPYTGTGNEGFLQGMPGERLWNALGTTIHDGNICARAGSAGIEYLMGSRFGLDPAECRRAGLILLWGTNPLTSHNHVWRFVTQARANGARVVAIDPVRTESAARSDEHLALVPGTDAALALGLLNVVIGLGAEDRAYLTANTLGWDEYRARIEAFPPERAAAITGVPAETIRALGERLATTRPTAILTKMGLQRHAGGGQALRTIMTIPAVTGDWALPGGGAAYSTGDYFRGNVDALTRSDLRRAPARSLEMSRLGAHLLETDPPVRALLVLAANPMASNPDQARVRQGLARDDLFTVVADHFQTDTADYADIVLPATMQPEHMDLLNAYGHTHLIWNEPAVAPAGECLTGTEFARRRARAMGRTEPELFASDEELARSLLDTDDPSLAGVTLERLRAEGWVRLGYPDPLVAYPRGFGTPSGQIEFRSERAAADGLDPLPGWTPAAEVDDAALAARYPLTLISAASPWFVNSTFANKPDLARRAGPTRVVLHPADAAARGLAEGDAAVVRNDRGSFQARVAVDDAVHTGVALSPKGRWPKLEPGGATTNATTSDRLSDMGGAVFHDNRVEVEAAR